MSEIRVSTGPVQWDSVDDQTITIMVRRDGNAWVTQQREVGVPASEWPAMTRQDATDKARELMTAIGGEWHSSVGY